jgi:hypothetical protein
MNRLHSLALGALFLIGLGSTTPPPAQAADRTIVVEFFSNHL